MEITSISCIYPRLLPNLDKMSIQYVHTQYEAMSEEFYTWSKLLVVGPMEAAQWCDAIHKALSPFPSADTSLHIHKFCNDSGRISLCALLTNLRVGFPVDYIYGWDLSLSENQKKLGKANYILLRRLSYYSPRCSPWNTALNANSNRKNKRGKEKTILQWITVRSIAIIANGDHNAFCLENLQSSVLFSESTVATIRINHGAADQDLRGQPIRKSTSLVSYGIMLTDITLAKCAGRHKSSFHGELRGEVNGINITATSLTAAYPWSSCFSTLRDSGFLQWGPQTDSWYMDLWS
jgi:hypothetical protein